MSPYLANAKDEFKKMKDDDRRKLKGAISGILVVDKPVGMTSHDVVAIVRKGIGLRRIGHTGTLDPRAGGVLVILIGPAVRMSEYLVSSHKSYEAAIRLGAVSDTYDSEGIICKTNADVNNITESMVLDAMEKLTGDQEQMPPAYSALKIKGKKAYELAREGKEVALAPRNVTVYRFDLLDFSAPDISADIYCSSGTYVRSIAHDLGQALGCGAYLSALRRTLCGKFTLRDAIPLQTLLSQFDEGTWYQNLIPAADALPDFEEVVFSMETEKEIRHGRKIEALPSERTDGALAKGVSEQGELIAILVYCAESCQWKPKKVFYP